MTFIVAYAGKGEPIYSKQILVILFHFCILNTIFIYLFSNELDHETSKIVCCFERQKVTRESQCELNKRRCDYDHKNPPQCSHKASSPMCACIEGYYLSVCGICVEKADCGKDCKGPEIQSTAPNEILYSCHDGSVNRLCPHLKKSPKSSDICSCNHSNPKSDGLVTLYKYDCRPETWRNDCGQCVQFTECKNKCEIKATDPCSDPNSFRKEHPQKSDFRTCKGIHGEYDQKSLERNVCVCKDGYLSDDCGRCIPPAQCNLPCRCTCPCQKRHEEWMCNNQCRNNTCADYYLRQRIRCTSNCSYECNCKNRYWRMKNGFCQTEKTCLKAIKNLDEIPN